jgi:hypothetical protein
MLVGRARLTLSKLRFRTRDQRIKPLYLKKRNSYQSQIIMASKPNIF